MEDKKVIKWSDLGQIALELCGGKLALDVVGAILPAKQFSLIAKGTTMLIGSAVGNMAYHNQVDPLSNEIEQLLEEIRKAKIRLKEQEASKTSES
jgi:hypothetical protein